jgi:hypothetical protein
MTQFISADTLQMRAGQFARGIALLRVLQGCRPPGTDLAIMV